MEEIDLKELIEIFLGKKFLIITVILIFAILGAVYTTNFITPVYESSTVLVLVQTGDNSSSTSLEQGESITSSDLALNSKLVYNYTGIANRKVVPSTVIKNLKLDMTVEELQENISVSSLSDTEIMTISVKNEDPALAAKIANEFVKVFMTKIQEIYKVQNVHVLDKAEIPTEPCNINLAKNIVIFAFVGAILVSGYILLINMLDTTIKTDTDIERTTGLPVLASIILTDEGNKKKIKDKNKKVASSASSEKREIPYSNNVQFFYDDDKESSGEDVDLFSYSNNDENDTSSSVGRRSINHKKNRRKDGR